MCHRTTQGSNVIGIIILSCLISGQNFLNSFLLRDEIKCIFKERMIHIKSLQTLSMTKGKDLKILAQIFHVGYPFPSWPTVAENRKKYSCLTENLAISSWLP